MYSYIVSDCSKRNLCRFNGTLLVTHWHTVLEFFICDGDGHCYLRQADVMRSRPFVCHSFLVWLCAASSTNYAWTCMNFPKVRQTRS